MCVTCGCNDVEGDASMGHAHVHGDGTMHTHAHADRAQQFHTHAHEDGTVHSHAAAPAGELYPAAAALHGDGHRLHALTRLHPHAHPPINVSPNGWAPAATAALRPAPPERADPLIDADDRSRTIPLQAQILGKNQLIAERNRGWLSGRAILALNLVSSPGAGKTTLLERTLTDLKSELKIGVIEGDQATSNDAERIRKTGVPALQINTGTGCHLDAAMVERALGVLKPEFASLLLIENVGNLVCPALFDLGERAKVVIFSVTEGEDKPLKYPHMFASADVLLISKIDLLPHLRFDVERAVDHALSVNPRLTVFRLSAETGAGLAPWYGWLQHELEACRRAGS